MKGELHHVKKMNLQGPHRGLKIAAAGQKRRLLSTWPQLGIRTPGLRPSHHLQRLLPVRPGMTRHLGVNLMDLPCRVWLCLLPQQVCLRPGRGAQHRVRR